MNMFVSLTLFTMTLPVFFMSTRLMADTKRMQEVISLLGIDDETGAKGAEAARDAVDKLVEKGVNSYPSMRVRAAELDAKKAQTDAAKANYQPNLSLNAYTGRSRLKDLGSDIESTQSDSDLRLTLRENLWKGGQDTGQIKIAQQDESVALIGQDYEREALSYSIRKAALDYNYHSLRQVIEEATLADATELYGLADKKFQVGQAGKIDVHNASVRQALARANAAREAQQAAQAFVALKGLVGPTESEEELERATDFLKRRSLPFSKQSLIPTAVPSSVKTFEEKNAEALTTRAEITLDQGYRQRFYPSLDLVGNFDRRKSRNDAFGRISDYESRLSETSVQVQLNWTLWDRSKDHLNRSAAFLKVGAEAQRDAAHYKAQTESLRLTRALTDLYRSLAIAREAYQVAGELYDAQHKLYEAGVVAIQPLIDAERDKREAISTWQQSVYELQLNVLQYEALQRGYLQAQI